MYHNLEDRKYPDDFGVIFPVDMTTLPYSGVPQSREIQTMIQTYCKRIIAIPVDVYTEYDSPEGSKCDLGLIKAESTFLLGLALLFRRTGVERFEGPISNLVISDSDTRVSPQPINPIGYGFPLSDRALVQRVQRMLGVIKKGVDAYCTVEIHVGPILLDPQAEKEFLELLTKEPEGLLPEKYFAIFFRCALPSVATIPFYQELYQLLEEGRIHERFAIYMCGETGEWEGIMISGYWVFSRSIFI